jgi:hypothetical protein
MLPIEEEYERLLVEVADSDEKLVDITLVDCSLGQSKIGGLPALTPHPTIGMVGRVHVLEDRFLIDGREHCLAVDYHRVTQRDGAHPLACASGSGIRPPRRSKPAPINTAVRQPTNARASGLLIRRNLPNGFSRRDLTRPLAPTQDVSVLRGAGRECGCRVEAGRLRPVPRQARRPTRWRLARSVGEGHQSPGRGPGSR